MDVNEVENAGHNQPPPLEDVYQQQVQGIAKRPIWSQTWFWFLLLVGGFVVGDHLEMNWKRFKRERRERAVKVELAKLEKAVADYKNCLGEYPAKLEDLTKPLTEEQKAKLVDKDKIAKFPLLDEIPFNPIAYSDSAVGVEQAKDLYGDYGWVYDNKTGKVYCGDDYFQNLDDE